MSNNNELAVIDVEEQRPASLMPVMDLGVAHQRWEAIRAFVGQILVRDEDYGSIPGTSGKPGLFKSGAEKLCVFFGLAAEFEVVQRVENWEKHHFHYEVRCRLRRDGQLRGEGLASCSSLETRYQRTAERKCPACGANAIIRGKEEFSGGWLCFGKRGGCGQKYKNGDLLIENQETGRIPNPDIPANTFLKMSMKRSLVSAVLCTTAASMFFSQDMEDAGEPPQTAPPTPPSPGQRNELQTIQESMRDRPSIASAIDALRERLTLRLGAEEADAAFERLLRHHDAGQWQELKNIGAARKFVADLYALTRGDAYE